MMTGSRKTTAALTFTLALGLAGCRLDPENLTGEPSRGPGRAKLMSGAEPIRSAGPSASVDLYPAVRATLAVLDDLKIHPESLTVENGARKDLPLRSADLTQATSNAGLFPADQPNTQDLFVRHRLPTGKPEQPPIPFDPVALDYHGKAADGRPVAVVVRIEGGDRPQLALTARIGKDGDEPWSRAFLEKVTAKMIGGMAEVKPTATSPASPG